MDGPLAVLRPCAPQEDTNIRRAILQIIIFFFRILETHVNDLYPWPPAQRDKIEKGFIMDQKSAYQRVEVNLTWYQHIAGIVHIPFIKRVVQFLFNLGFLILFTIVAFQPLCLKMNWTHVVLFVWTVANLLQSIYEFVKHHSLHGFESNNIFEYFSKTYKIAEVLTSFILLTFFFTALGFRWYANGDPDPFKPLPSRSNDVGLIEHWDGKNNGSLRQNQGLVHETAGFDFVLPEEDCGWTHQTETLRSILAVAALPVVFQITEIFSVFQGLGVLLQTANSMLNKVFIWLPIVCFCCLAFGISLNVLNPHFQAEHGAGLFRPFGFDAELDLSAAGSFFSPAWATFGYYHPGELSGAPGGAFIAPTFMWVYLLLVLVLCVNLLIAMFNAAYEDVQQTGGRPFKMMNVRRVMVYLVQYPIPAPVNLIILPFDLAHQCLTGCWRRRKAKKERAKNRKAVDQEWSKRTALMRQREMNGGGPPPPSPASSRSMLGAKAAAKWRRNSIWSDSSDDSSADFELKGGAGTRRYLMERAMNQRPFQYSKELVFTRAEANAVERAALGKYQTTQKTLEERQNQDQVTNDSMEEIHRRLAQLASNLESSSTTTAASAAPMPVRDPSLAVPMPFASARSELCSRSSKAATRANAARTAAAANAATA